MINLGFEKTAALDPQERYDIISMAMDAADDNGFINSFIFERALYCFAAIILYPERRDELAPAFTSDLLGTWKQLVEEGTIQEMKDQYPEEIKVLCDEGAVWYDEYADYAHSARGILEMVQAFTGNITQNAAQLLTNTAQETGVQDLLEVADSWGIGKDALKPANENRGRVIEAESLFKQE